MPEIPEPQLGAWTILPALERTISGYHVQVFLTAPGGRIIDSFRGREESGFGEWDGYMDVYRIEKVNGRRVGIRMPLNMNALKEWEHRSSPLGLTKVSTLRLDNDALGEQNEYLFNEAVRRIEEAVVNG